jgi:hypothetical protein
MSPTTRHTTALPTLVALALFSLAPFQAHAASPQSPKANPKVDPKTIPVVDGAIGSCSADFTVTDAAGAPVYAADIRVHIAYRFMNLHKLDLEVGTNADGKARFIGLPDNSKQGLFFRASESDREASAFDDPSKTCKAEFTLALRKKAD